ncbi:hypothetical protein [Streptomyces odontomachi]|uniref:hypothetical protein n=1 Tax=Streptomyces odontomachi TaxID=2944940 RepID=UPI00210A923A|nr:hypothetical protein [Streptomyces sp. ODS25]
MNTSSTRRIIQRIALSGSAAIALLGGAATLGTISAEPAQAAEVQAAVDRAAGATVTLPDGRTMHIRGMENASYRADASQRTTVENLAAGGNDNLNLGPGAVPDYSGAGQQMGTNPQQYQNQAGAGAISITVAIGIGLAVIAVAWIRKGTVRALNAVVLIALGVYLAPTVFGPMITNLGGSLGSSLGNIWTGL